MTVDSQTNKISYVPDGIEDTFAFDFRVDEASDMVVYADNVIYAGGRSVTNLTDPNGGDVIFDSPPLSTISVLTLVREVPLTQETAYPTLGPFPAESHEAALDKLTFIAQQLGETVSRAAVAPIDVDTTDYTLPPYAAGEVWLWDLVSERIITESLTITIDTEGSLIANTVTALRLVTPSANTDRAILRGYYAVGDGGGGPERYGVYGAPAGTYVDNGGSIMVPGDGSSAWLFNSRGEQISVLAYGVKGDVVTDDTVKMNTCLYVERNIWFPAKTYSIDATLSAPLAYGILPSSNSILTFAEGATLQAITNADATYGVIYMRSRENITIYGGIFSGDKDTHTGVTGEGGHAISMYDAKNIKIYNAQGNNGWGVGIAVVRGEDIYVENCSFDNNRQNGGAMISGKNITFVNPVFSNTSGASPEGGFDFEPNGPTDLMEDIHFINPKTVSNAGVGIIFALNQIVDSDGFVSITVDNHQDYDSAGGMSFEKFNESVSGSVDGQITVNNPVWFESKLSGVAIKDYAALRTPHIYINNPSVLNCNRNDIASPQYGSAYIAYRESTSVENYVQGNFTITNPIARDTGGTPRMLSGFYMRDGGGGGSFQNAQVIDPIEVSGLAVDEINSYFQSDKGVELTDRFNIISADFASTKSLSVARMYTELRANGVGQINFNLITGLQKNSIKFTEKSGNGIRITPEAGDVILPLSTVAGKYIEVTGRGNSITVRKNDDDTYYVENIIGTWTVEP